SDGGPQFFSNSGATLRLASYLGVTSAFARTIGVKHRSDHGRGRKLAQVHLEKLMPRIVPLLIATTVAAAIGVVAHMTSASGQADKEAAPIYGIKIPKGYRNWQLISVNRLAGGNLKQVRAQLGNDIAIRAFREGKLPFPDGTIIAALHWNETASDENNKV